MNIFHESMTAIFQVTLTQLMLFFDEPTITKLEKFKNFFQGKQSQLTIQNWQFNNKDIRTKSTDLILMSLLFTLNTLKTLF